MKRSTLSAIAILVTAGFAGAASAHTQGGSLNTTAPTPPVGAVAPLNTAVAATDFYQVQCFDDGSGTGNTDHVAFQIKANAASVPAGSLITAHVQQGNAAEFAVQGAGTAYGSWAKVYKGNNIYNVLISHTAATTVAHGYTLTIHCENAANGHTGTSVTSIQNQ